MQIYMSDIIKTPPFKSELMFNHLFKEQKACGPNLRGTYTVSKRFWWRTGQSLQKNREIIRSCQNQWFLKEHLRQHWKGVKSSPSPGGLAAPAQGQLWDSAVEEGLSLCPVHLVVFSTWLLLPQGPAGSPSPLTSRMLYEQKTEWEKPYLVTCIWTKKELIESEIEVKHT